MAGKSSRECGTTAAAGALSALIAIGFASAAPARADEWNGDDWALNGTFHAISNGDWAAPMTCTGARPPSGAPGRSR